MSGVEVTRQLARARGSLGRALMPVVFTSAVAHPRRDATAERRSPGTATPGKPGTLYGISQTPQVWIDHQVSEHRGALLYNWDCVEELFPPGLLDDMFGAYEELLARLADDDGSWSELDREHLPEGQATVRARVNATEGPLSDDRLEALVWRRVAEQAGQPAVIAVDRTLTYERLQAEARTAARRLLEAGTQPGDLVAIAMRKGWEQAVAALAVLEAGAAYVPVDPDLPPERFREILEHASVRVALTQPGPLAAIEWPADVRPLALHAEDEAADPGPLRAPGSGQEDIAYVIYTSGSTGRPKGVVIDHRGAVNTIEDINRRFGVAAGDRVLALSSLSFDLSVYDIFGVLAAGGTVVVPASGTSRAPEHWLELMRRHGVTIWNTVPALMEMLVEHLEGREERIPEALRLVMMSGDWIPLSLPDRIRRLCAHRPDVVSLGGATEASIWSIFHPIGVVEAGWRSVPYGRPLANQRFHVLDGVLTRRPDWVAGDLYIGGAGLAKGYWRDPATTARSFVRHPRTGERLYRTGDLGRALPDGNIEFLGREDSQVKVHGHRIELGEIEKAALGHPAVEAAVAAAIGDPKGKRRLALYIVAGRRDEAPPGLVEDPVERIAFKLREEGIRRDLDDRSVVPLGADATDPDPLDLARRSYHSFQEGPVGQEALAALLGCLRRLEVAGQPKYRYPSAGGLYPVQVYVYVKPGMVAGVAPGGYYYDRARHVLAPLSPGMEIEREAWAAINRPVFDGAAFALFLVARMRAIAPMYGANARDFCLLEAGYMSQLLMSGAAGGAIGLCPIGGLAFGAVAGELGLDADHLLVHTLLGGRVDPDLGRLRQAYEKDAEERATAAAFAGEASVAGVDQDGSRRRPSSARLGDDVREHLRGRLPSYMVPQHVVVLDAMPLNANGKVDRKALPDPAPADAVRPSARPPMDEDERTVAQIFAEVLEVERVDVDGNFFDLGGQSVLAIKAVSGIQRSFGVEIPLRTIFQYRTVRELADVIKAARAELRADDERLDTPPGRAENTPEPEND